MKGLKPTIRRPKVVNVSGFKFPISHHLSFCLFVFSYVCRFVFNIFVLSVSSRVTLNTLSAKPNILKQENKCSNLNLVGKQTRLCLSWISENCLEIEIYSKFKKIQAALLQFGANYLNTNYSNVIRYHLYVKV